MFAQAFAVVVDAVSSVFSIFSVLVNRLKFGGLLMTLFTIYTVVRLLLKPLLGSAGVGSDKVARRIKNNNSDSE